MKITLIHAMQESVSPIEVEFNSMWPEARLQNILDDGLPAAVRESGTEGFVTKRILLLTGYAAACGTDAVLFTCSAFGPSIAAAVRAFSPLPIQRPNEGMIEESVRHGGRIGLVATFAPTLATMPGEFPPNAKVTPIFVEGALDALKSGDGLLHDSLIVEAVRKAGVDVVAIAQFSAARAAPAIEDAIGKSVLTTPRSAVRKLKRSLLTSS